jgi:putative ABC transport system permease protein
MKLRDALSVGGVGLRTRRLRAALSGLGIAIGIAAMVAVLGVSESSRADLIAELDRLGTNLLTVAPGQTFKGDAATLPPSATGMIGRIPDVDAVAATSPIDANVYRSDRIDPDETSGIAVRAAEVGLLDTLNGRITSGTWLNAATDRYPAVVLGSVAASRLGIDHAGPDVSVWLGDQWFTVVGILDTLPLAPEIDRAVLIGFPAAESLFAHDGAPGTIYLRTQPDSVDAVRALLPPTADPENPEEVNVSRPSDALSARAAAKATFTALLLGLGAVALLVGGVGIANVMVISVLERRSEIGLRRALGATRGNVRSQFLIEALLLAGLGGLGGVALGSAVTAAYGRSQGWIVVVPVAGLAGGVIAALAIGALAGVYPAIRAARLAPTEALRSV